MKEAHNKECFVMVLRSFMVLVSIFMLLACASTHHTDTVVLKDAPSDSLKQVSNTHVLSYEADLAQRSLETEELELTPEKIKVLEKEQLTEVEEKVLEAEVGFDFFLDARETQAMENYFKMYTHTHRKSFETWLKRAETFLPYIREIFEERDLPTDLIYLPFAESGFNPIAYSRAGAAGLWQFMPATARHYGLRVDWWIDERRNPYLSTYTAADYLEKLHCDFNDWYLALAAYNAGEGRVARAMTNSGHDNYFDLINGPYLARETRDYVPKFLAILKIMHNLEELGFEPVNWDSAPRLKELEVRPGTDLLALSRKCDMSWDEFKKLNPAFRRQVSPSDAVSIVMIPAERHETARSFLDSPDSRPYAGFQRYQVKSGDSWWRISNRFGVPVSILKSVNNTTSNLLRVGQHVIVPASGSSGRAVAASSTTQDYAQRRGTYIVQRGETLSAISRKFNVDLNTLMAANGISDPRSLKAGQNLYIPGPTRAAQDSGKRQVNYQVRNGDTLWAIARRFGVQTSDLQRWNNISGNQIIRPGDSLRVFLQ